MKKSFPEIRDLAVIGDRRTAALIATDGSIVWYCPERFDFPSMFAALLDPEKGGVWSFEMSGAVFASRRYLEDSGVLETGWKTEEGELRVTDWMPVGDNLPRGICRRFSAAPKEINVVLQPALNYTRSAAKFERKERCIEIVNPQNEVEDYYFYASHPISISEEHVCFKVPQGEEGWAVLVNDTLAPRFMEEMDEWLKITIERWEQITSHITYHGPYKTEVADSIRALRLLTYEENGGIIAAPTTSLPEVIGGHRNYDYRYVWLRDAGMIVSALIRAGSDGSDGRNYLDFICGYDREFDGLPLMPFLTLDGDLAPNLEQLDLAGYKYSKPVVVGNVANKQLQFDAYGNVLLAAKLIYQNFDTREHWGMVENLADFLAENWREPDYGIWEEEVEHQYTTGKVIVACGLKFIAEVVEDKSKAERWLAVEKEIRDFVAKNCINSEGAYSAIAGGEAVDVSAALFPIWDFTAPDSPAMKATIKALERDHSEGNLYWRHLEQFDSKKEGAFLAGTLWVAQYWIMRRDFRRAQAILEAALRFSNDLGLFSEQADPKTGLMLGNFPQTFVHAALIGAAIDLKKALENEPLEIRELFYKS